MTMWASPDVCDVLTCFYQEGRYSDVLNSLELRVAKLLGQLDSESIALLAFAKEDLSWILYSMGRYSDSIVQLEDTVRVVSNRFGKNSPHYARCINKLGRLYLQTGERLADAESLLTQARRITESLPEQDQGPYASILSSLAFMHMLREEFDLAESLYVRALRWRLNRYGEHHPRYALTFEELGRLYWCKGDNVAAEKSIRKAIRICCEAGFNQDAMFASLLVLLGDLEQQKGNSSASNTLYESAFVIVQKVRPHDHWQVDILRKRLETS